MSSSNVSTEPASGKALVQEKFNQLMNYGPVKSFFDKAEEKTGKNRLTLVQYGLVPLVLLFGNTVVALLCSLLATLYPSYSCLKAVLNDNEEEQRRWVEYWIVMSLLYVTDLIFSPLLSTLVPFFWLVRLSVLVWCIAPSANNGSSVIFARVVYPLFLKFGKHIDDSVDKARDLFSVGVDEVKTAVKEVVEEATENVLAEAIGSVLDEAKEAIENVLDEAIAGEAVRDEASAGETVLNGTIYAEILQDGAIESKNSMDEADDSIQLLEAVTEMGNKFVEASKNKMTEGFVEASKIKLTEGFSNLTDGAA